MRGGGVWIGSDSETDRVVVRCCAACDLLRYLYFPRFSRKSDNKADESQILEFIASINRELVSRSVPHCAAMFGASSLVELQLMVELQVRDKVVTAESYILLLNSPAD